MIYIYFFQLKDLWKSYRHAQELDPIFKICICCNGNIFLSFRFLTMALTVPNAMDTIDSAQKNAIVHDQEFLLQGKVIW